MNTLGIFEENVRGDCTDFILFSMSGCFHFCVLLSKHSQEMMHIYNISVLFYEWIEIEKHLSIWSLSAKPVAINALCHTQSGITINGVITIYRLCPFMEAVTCSKSCRPPGEVGSSFDRTFCCKLTLMGQMSSWLLVCWCACFYTYNNEIFFMTWYYVDIKKNQFFICSTMGTFTAWVFVKENLTQQQEVLNCSNKRHLFCVFSHGLLFCLHW